MTSSMARETAEAPAAVARLISDERGLDAVVARLAGDHRPVAVICGRGSSGHAGVFWRYLIETRLGIPVSATAPSIVTSYRTELKLAKALFVVISQSGRSPDLVAATQSARDAGAATLAVINDPDSPVARAAELVLPLNAGVETSVAATKTVIASMAAGAALVARWADDEELKQALIRLPVRLQSALTLDWSALSASLARPRCALVTARGHTLGVAREIALKLSETLRLPALSYSAAELRHGPRAAISRDTPVLVLRQADATASSIDDLVTELAAARLDVHLCGGPHTTLPWVGDDHPVCDAMAMLGAAYRMVEATARAAGYDPDHPPFLTKVTRTF